MRNRELLGVGIWLGIVVSAIVLTGWVSAAILAVIGIGLLAWIVRRNRTGAA